MREWMNSIDLLGGNGISSIELTVSGKLIVQVTTECGCLQISVE